MTPSTSQTIRDILLTAEDSSDAFAQLYEFFKKRDKKFSFGYICLKTGVKSKGHISDIVSRRRRITPKYRHAFARLFKLDETEEAYFKSLILLDSTTDAEKRKPLEARCAGLKKALMAETRSLVDFDSPSLYTTFEVFSAFGFFHNRPTASDLKKLYKNRPEVMVDQALKELQKFKMIVPTSDGHFEIPSERIHFNHSSSDVHTNYLKTSLQHAIDNIDAFFTSRNCAYFDSKVISVSMDDFERILKDYRVMTQETIANLDSSQANGLVRFNVQVFPVKF